MPSVNEYLRDEAISRAVDLAQYSNGSVRRMLALLNRTDADLMRALQDALEKLPPESFTVDRLDALLQSVRWLNAQAYQQVGQALTEELRKLTEVEATYQFELFSRAIPPQVVASVGIAQVEAAQVYAAAMSRPFSGRLLREWSQSLEADRAARIRDAVRIGYVEQQPIPEIVRRLRGTRARGYADGLMEAPRRHLEAIVRTAVSHTASTVRDSFFDRNSDLIKAVQWSSTIDLRTTEICRLRDGLKFTPDTHKPIGHSYPWGSGPGRAHWNCRSSAVPVTKSWRELGIDADDATDAERASMDGAVPAATTYLDWLAKQSAGRQDQVLGPERAKLYRVGKLGLRDMYDHKGRWLTLDELAARV
jgi:hypothetical protein